MEEQVRNYAKPSKSNITVKLQAKCTRDNNSTRRLRRKRICKSKRTIKQVQRTNISMRSRIRTMIHKITIHGQIFGTSKSITGSTRRSRSLSRRTQKRPTIRRIIRESRRRSYIIRK